MYSYQGPIFPMNTYKIILPIVSITLFALYLWWRKRTIQINEFRQKYLTRYTPKHKHEAIKFKPDEVLVRINGGYRVFWMSKRGKWHSRPITFREALCY